MTGIIFGLNPVRVALRAKRPINKILLAKGREANSLKEIIDLARECNIPVQWVERSLLDRLSNKAAHQGIIAISAAKKYVELDEMLNEIMGKKVPLFILLLDGIVDPINLGTILRVADAVGVDGVVIPKQRAVALTASVAKTSAGAIEFVPVARVTNLVNTLVYLKKCGFWVVGADANARKIYWDETLLAGSIALVIGNEGKGLRRLVRENCDLLVRIPMAGRLNSLNASVATALLAYEILRRRNG